MEFPKVLMLTSSVFNERTGGGITFSNLFRGWPIDRLAAVHSDSETPSTDVCNRYFKLGDAELGRERAFAALGRGPQDRGNLSNELLDFVGGFKPDVIYTLLGSLGYVRLAGKLGSATGAAIVPHMMDDWPLVIYGKSFFGSLLRRRLDAELRGLFRVSATRLAISPAMATEYQARYGCDFRAVSNPVEADKWKVVRSQARGSGRTVLYVGAVLAEAQLTALAEVAAAIDLLNQSSNEIRLHVATPNFANPDVMESLSAFGSVSLTDVPGENGIADLVGSADLLLLPANFTESSIKYLRLSNPTKIPSYMASGVPVLVYAPEELDMTQRALRDGWGIVMASDERRLLAETILRALNDDVLRRHVVAKARVTFERDHEASRVRREFRDILSGAASQARR